MNRIFWGWPRFNFDRHPLRHFKNSFNFKIQIFFLDPASAHNSARKMSLLSAEADHLSLQLMPGQQ
jgi:hypothetical protein